MPDVKISEELYKLLVDYHLYNVRTHDNAQLIELMLTQKEEARQKRIFYKAMHDQNLSDDQRAAAKEMYQDLVGVPEDFRY